jgi:hypothetical protein
MDPRFLSFVLLAGLAVADPSSPVEECLKAPFHGITETSPDGTQTGKIDRQDWGCANSPRGHAVSPEATSDVPVPPQFDLCLYKAYPNPAQNAVRITFGVPATQLIHLTIYGQNLGHGRPEAFPVRVLVDSNLNAGLFEVAWDLRDDQGASVPSGIYRAVLEGQGETLCGDIEVQ